MKTNQQHIEPNKHIIAITHEMIDISFQQAIKREHISQDIDCIVIRDPKLNQPNLNTTFADKLKDFNI